MPLPPYYPELNPVGKRGDLVKGAICKRFFAAALRPLEAISAGHEPSRLRRPEWQP